jgi:hypothetical protein
VATEPFPVGADFHEVIWCGENRRHDSPRIDETTGAAHPSVRMKKLWLLPVFACGTLVGWLARDGMPSQPKAVTSETQPTKTKRDRTTETSQNSYAQKWRALSRQSQAFTQEEREKFINQLPPEDRLKALEALMADAGPKGLSTKTLFLMTQILGEWAKTDFEGAWDDCAKCQSPGLRKFMQSELIDLLASKDPARALSSLQDLAAEDPAVDTKAIVTLARGEMGKNPEQLLALVTALPDARTFYSSGLTYPEDFDFEKLASGLADIEKKNPGKAMGFGPDNVLGAWADRDPEGAHAWWLKGEKFDYNGWGQILDSVEKRSTPESAAAWAVEKFEDPGAPREKMIRELSGGTSQASKINGIARAMPDIAAQDRFLSEVVQVNWNGLDRNYGFALTGLSSPQARLETLRKLSADNHQPNIGGISDAQFQTWGITRTEVEQIFKANK